MGYRSVKPKENPHPDYQKNFKGVYYYVGNMLDLRDEPSSPAKQAVQPEEKRAAYIERLALSFKCLFTESKEQIYDINQQLDLNKLKARSPSPVKEAPRPQNYVPKKHRPFAGQMNEKDITSVREKLLSERQIYNSKGIKTEESAEVEAVLKDPSFSESSLREMEYLSRGAAYLLKYAALTQRVSEVGPDAAARRVREQSGARELRPGRIP